jgi:hypothetical protein
MTPFLPHLSLRCWGFLWLMRMLPARGDSAVRVPAGRLRSPTTADSRLVLLLSIIIYSIHHPLYHSSYAPLRPRRSDHSPVFKGTYYDVYQGVFENKLVRFILIVSGIYRSSKI